MISATEALLQENLHRQSAESEFEILEATTLEEKLKTGISLVTKN